MTRAETNETGTEVVVCQTASASPGWPAMHLSPKSMVNNIKWVA